MFWPQDTFSAHAVQDKRFCFCDNFENPLEFSLIFRFTLPNNLVYHLSVQLHSGSQNMGKMKADSWPKHHENGLQPRNYQSLYSFLKIMSLASNILFFSTLLSAKFLPQSPLNYAFIVLRHFSNLLSQTHPHSCHMTPFFSTNFYLSLFFCDKIPTKETQERNCFFFSHSSMHSHGMAAYQ